MDTSTRRFGSARALDWIWFDLTRPENHDVWPALSGSHPARSRIELVDLAWWMHSTCGHADPERPVAPSHLRESELPLCKPNPGNHVDQLLERNRPGPGAKPAIGGHMDPVGIAEHVDGVEDPIADELG